MSTTNMDIGVEKVKSSVTLRGLQLPHQLVFAQDIFENR
jgi:hypothetical protein